MDYLQRQEFRLLHKMSIKIAFKQIRFLNLFKKSRRKKDVDFQS
jgi:hypothetical protein